MTHHLLSPFNYPRLYSPVKCPPGQKPLDLGPSESSLVLVSASVGAFSAYTLLNATRLRDVFRAALSRHDSNSNTAIKEESVIVDV